MSYEHVKNFRNNRKNQIDYFSTFWDGKCYLIPVEECGTASKKIRFDNPKNNQTRGITFAKDYELSVVINKIIKENLKHWRTKQANKSYLILVD